MTRCERFEREGAARVEAGLPLDDHFDRCPDCREARRTYERIADALAEPAAHDRPPEGWQRAVWASIDEAGLARRSRRWLWVLAPAAAAAALLVTLSLPRGSSASPSLTVDVRQAAGTAWRGTVASPGDTLILVAKTGDAPEVELRVYHDESQLALSCSSQPPCVRRRGELRAELTLGSVGAYQGVLITSQSPIPPSQSELDADAGAVRRAGGRIELAAEIRVR